MAVSFSVSPVCTATRMSHLSDIVHSKPARNNEVSNSLRDSLVL
jgi:hypothetical protein